MHHPQTYQRPKDDQNFWDLVLSVLFALLLIAAGWSLWRAYGAYPWRIGWLDALLLSLAVFRITRLLVYDKITRFIREWFMLKKEVTHDDGTKWVQLSTRKKGLFAAVHDLLQCPWCTGMWVALVAVWGYFLFPWAWFVMLMLAVSGAASIVQLMANRTGWKAEKLKLEVEKEEGESAHAC